MSYKLGQVRVIKGFWKNSYEVFIGKEKVTSKFVRFFSFENAQIFGQLVKLNDRFRDLDENG